MYDAKKIIPGIVIFLVLMTLPVWYNLASGKSQTKPDIKQISTAKECVLPKDRIVPEHMELLNHWRDEVVRKGKRFITINGNKYEMSLTKTCLKCHTNKSQFCDRCHDYMAVEPYCWECHVVPKEHE